MSLDQNKLIETKNLPLQKPYWSLSFYCSFLIFGIGALALLGWVAEVYFLASIIPGLNTMKPNTAFCFVFLGGAVFILSFEKKYIWMSIVLYGLLLSVFTLSFITLMEHIFKANFNINRSVFEFITGYTLPSQTGGMSPISSVTFIVTCIGFYAVSWKSRAGNRIAQGASLLTTCLTFFSLIGYGFFEQSFYRFASWTGMALNTIIGFFIAALAIASLCPKNSLWKYIFSKTRSGRSARRLIISGFIYPVLLGWLIHLGNMIGILHLELSLSLFALLSALLFFYLALRHTEAHQNLEKAQMETKKSLVESELRFRTLVEQAPFGMAMLNNDMNYLAVSKRWYTDFNLPLNIDLTGRNHYDVFPDISDRWKDVHQRCLNGATEKCSEEAFRRKDGTLEWLMWEVQPWRKFNGKIGGILMYTEEISVRKNAENKIHLIANEAEKQRSQLEAVFQSMSEGVMVFEMDGSVSLLNEAEARICGYANKEEMKQNLEFFNENFELYYPDGNKVPMEEWPVSQVMRGHALFGLELRVRRKDTGQEWWFHYSGKPIFESNGVQVRSLIVTRDITEEKFHEFEQKKWEHIFRSARWGMGVAWPDKKIIEVNPAFAQMHGTEVEEWKGRHLIEMFAEESKGALSGLAEIGTTTGHVTYESIHVKKDGTKFPVLTDVSVIKDEKGVPLYQVSNYIDLSEMKLADAQLKKSEEQFRATFNQAAAGIAHVALDGRWLKINKKFSEMLGYEQEELLQKTFQDITHQDDIDKDLAFVKQMLNGEITNYSMEKRYIKKNKKSFWANLTVSFAYDAETGEPKYFISVVEDISEKRATRESLKRLNIELEDRVHKRTEELLMSNADLEQFAYVASHDLREPLRMISSYVDLLSEDLEGKLNPTTTRYMKYIHEGATRTQSLISDLLFYSRVGRGELVKEKVSLHKVVQIALQNLKFKIEDSHAVIKVEPLSEVPVNTTLLAQVFQNILENAIKFRGNNSPVIIITSRIQNSECIVSINDNGIGIDAQYFERIFSIFQRLHTRTEYPGTGIGLAVCKRIVERHGGRIWVDSNPGKGTVFHFSLPYIEKKKEYYESIKKNQSPEC